MESICIEPLVQIQWLLASHYQIAISAGASLELPDMSLMRKGEREKNSFLATSDM